MTKAMLYHLLFNSYSLFNFCMGALLYTPFIIPFYGGYKVFIVILSIIICFAVFFMSLLEYIINFPLCSFIPICKKFALKDFSFFVFIALGGATVELITKLII